MSLRGQGGGAKDKRAPGSQRLERGRELKRTGSQLKMPDLLGEEASFLRQGKLGDFYLNCRIINLNFGNMTLFIQGKLKKHALILVLVPDLRDTQRWRQRPRWREESGPPPGLCSAKPGCLCVWFLQGGRLPAHTTVVTFCSQTCEVCVFEVRNGWLCCLWDGETASYGLRGTRPFHLYPSSPSPVTALPFDLHGCFYALQSCLILPQLQEKGKSLPVRDSERTNCPPSHLLRGRMERCPLHFLVLPSSQSPPTGLFCSVLFRS